MEITREKQAGGWVELRVKGRLDSYWADHFKTALEDLVREGTHKIRLNLAGVSYLSSAGIGALVWCHKHLESIRGKLVVANPSESVKEVLELTRLTTLLATEVHTTPAGEPMTVAMGRRVHRDEVSLEVFGQPSRKGLTCRLIGDAAPLQRGRFRPEDCRTVQFPATTLGIGLGALGCKFSDCQDRLGEFLAVAGAAAYLPTDGTNIPDYLVAGSDSVPELQVGYGIFCEGLLAHFTRFEADAESGRVSLSSLVQSFLDLAETDRIGLVLVGETTGLMGAALRRSLAASADEDSPFVFPRIRDWLTFTAERAYLHSMALVVGVAIRGEAGPLAPLVRPLGKEPSLLGHCHAAAFAYRPLPRGELELRPTVAALFEKQILQGILHLLPDRRETIGLGESEFVRGACWFGPINEILAERS